MNRQLVMRRPGLVPVATLMACLLGGWSHLDPGADARADEVNELREAIDVMSTELLNRRSDAFGWEPDPLPEGLMGHLGGRSALALLALLEIGHSMQEPELEAALFKVLQTDMASSYALSCRTMLLARLSEDYERALIRDANTLIAGFSPHVNGWGYSLSPDDKSFDNSTTQFAALALRDAADAGVRIPPDLWRRLELRFLAAQAPDGGWDYRSGEATKSSMTAAAVATLAVARRQIYREAYDKGADENVRRLEAAIKAGLTWLDEHFDPGHNHGRKAPYEYYAYYVVAIERAAHATGRTQFGGHEWFTECADIVVEKYCDRSEDGDLHMRHEDWPSNEDLSLALLFLHKGLLANAVADVGGQETLARPLAVKELTARIAARLEMRMGWIRLPEIAPQDLRARTAANLDHATMPAVLWFDVASDPDFFAQPDTPEFARIRDAVRAGGMLLCSVPGGRGRARVVAKELVALLPGTEWRDVQRGNPLLTEPWPVTIVPPAVEVTNGVRTLAVIVAGDPARGLQHGGRDAERTIDFLGNVCLRAHGGEPPKPHTRLLNPLDTEPSFTSGITHLAPGDRVVPEPGALAACNDRLARNGVGRFTAHLGELGVHEPNRETACVIVSGTDTWKPTVAEWQAIEAWLQLGVPVLVETTGGTGEFANGFAEAAATRYPDPIQSIDNVDAILGPSGPGELELQKVGWTSEALQRFGVGAQGHRLEHVKTPFTAELIVARFDLTHALLGRKASGVHGWRTPWADALLTRLLRARANGLGASP